MPTRLELDKATLVHINNTLCEQKLANSSFGSISRGKSTWKMDKKIHRQTDGRISSFQKSGIGIARGE